MFKRVCGFAAYKTHTSFNEPRQQVIDRCKKYITSLKINLSEIEEHWKTIDTFLNVRHLITHQGATFPYEKKIYHPNEKELVKHIKSNEYILVKHPRSKKPKQFLIIDHLYILEFLDVAQGYLLWIILQLPERRPKRSKGHKNEIKK